MLILDADERVPTELAAEIAAIVEASPPGRGAELGEAGWVNPPAQGSSVVAYRIRRQDYWRTTWLKHVQASPYYIRLFRPGVVRYEREINEVLKVDGLIAECQQPFHHYPFSKGMSQWLDKHNRYSHMEAQQIIDNRRNPVFAFSMLKAFTAPDFNERRFHQKELYYRLPFRPLIMFVLLYVAKRGFLDGAAGFHYALLRAFYEYMIVLKVRELERPVAS